jgi:hypothetical protein
MTAKKRGIKLKQVQSDDPGFSGLLGDAAQAPAVNHAPAPVAQTPSDLASWYELGRRLRQELEETLEILKQAVTDRPSSIPRPDPESSDQEP